MVRGYLEAERDLGRITAGADLGTLAPMPVSAVHLLFTDTDGPPPGEAAATVTAALAATAPALGLPDDRDLTGLPRPRAGHAGLAGKGADAGAGIMGGDGTVPAPFFFRDHDRNTLMIVQEFQGWHGGHP